MTLQKIKRRRFGSTYHALCDTVSLAKKALDRIAPEVLDPILNMATPKRGISGVAVYENCIHILFADGIDTQKLPETIKDSWSEHDSAFVLPIQLPCGYINFQNLLSCVEFPLASSKENIVVYTLLLTNDVFVDKADCDNAKAIETSMENFFGQSLCEIDWSRINESALRVKINQNLFKELFEGN